MGARRSRRACFPPTQGGGASRGRKLAPGIRRSPFIFQARRDGLRVCLLGKFGGSLSSGGRAGSLEKEKKLSPSRLPCGQLWGIALSLVLLLVSVWHSDRLTSSTRLLVIRQDAAFIFATAVGIHNLNYPGKAYAFRKQACVSFSTWDLGRGCVGENHLSPSPL